MEPLSPRNSEVARLRGLTRERRARHEAGRFLVEGIKLVAEVLESDLIVFEAYAAADWRPADDFMQALAADDVEVTALSERALERVASTNSPQPVVAEVKIPSWSFADLGGSDEGATPAVLVVVDLNDPGNLGTLMRSAVAAGFQAIVVLGDSADPFAPKVVRSSAGALFAVPVVVERDVSSGLAELAGLGFARLGTRMNDAVACDQADLTGPVAIVLGSEAHGLGASYDEFIDAWISVPMPGETESLNVAMAGTILAYETARQRRS